MADSRSTCVADTSVLIDLHVGGLVAPFFSLPYRFVAPDVILAELHDPEGTMLVDYGLQPGELAGEQVAHVFGLRQRYHRPSVNDLFALVLAQHLGAFLLTSDRHLRTAAIREGVAVHGSLWVLDELVGQAVIEPSHAAQALKRMLEHGSRLPFDECERRFATWGV